MKYQKTLLLNFSAAVSMMLGALSFQSCSDDDNSGSAASAGDTEYIGKAVGNFSEDEWYPGGRLGTTLNVVAKCYEDETPATTQMGLSSLFKKGEGFFEDRKSVV